MHVPINMSGVEDSVENYQSYLVACCAVMVFETYEIHFFFFFFRFVVRISIFLMIFLLIYAFTHIFFTAHTWERSGSVVECLTRDRRVAGSSLTGVTALWSLSKTHLS